jgi:hypothetical protein
MYWATALHDLAEHDAVELHHRAALARDTVYMPSEVAARVLPIRAADERVARELTARGADPRSPVR